MALGPEAGTGLSRRCPAVVARNASQVSCKRGSARRFRAAHAHRCHGAGTASRLDDQRPRLPPRFLFMCRGALRRVRFGKVHDCVHRVQERGEHQPEASSSRRRPPSCTCGARPIELPDGGKARRGQGLLVLASPWKDATVRNTPPAGRSVRRPSRVPPSEATRAIEYSWAAGRMRRLSSALRRRLDWSGAPARPYDLSLCDRRRRNPRVLQLRRPARWAVDSLLTLPCCRRAPRRIKLRFYLAASPRAVAATFRPRTAVRAAWISGSNVVRRQDGAVRIARALA